MGTNNPNHKATVRVVDDTMDNLVLMKELLKDNCRVKLVDSGEKARKAI